MGKLTPPALLLLSITACSGGSSSLPAGGSSSAFSSSSTFSGSAAGASAEQRDAMGSVVADNSQVSFASAVAADSPSAFYDFSTSGTLVDRSVNKLNGTLGSSVVRSGNGLFAGGAGSATFPGGTQSAATMATVPGNALLETKQGITVETWVEASAVNTSNHFNSIVSYGAENAGQPYVLHVTPQNSVQFWLKTSTGAAWADGVVSLTPGKLFQLVGTYDGQHANLYVNGSLVTTRTQSGGPIAFSTWRPGLAIGGSLNSSWPGFNGKVGSVEIFPQVLSASRILAHYTAAQASTSTPPPATPSPVGPSTPAPTTSQYDSIVMADSPTAFYKLDDSVNTMTDASVTRNNGTFASSIAHVSSTLTSAASVAALFPGGQSTGAFASAPIVAPANPTSAITVEAWVNQAKITPQFSLMLCNSCNGQAPAYLFEVTPQNGARFFLQTKSGMQYVTAGSLTPGQTTHLVGTYDGQTTSLYVNGQLQATAHQSGLISGYNKSGGLQIGGAPGNTVNFNGKMNDVAVYDHALSASEVQRHYEAGIYAPMTAERATSAQAFVDSIGVDMVADTDPNWNTYANDLIASGIRHYRQGLPQNAGYASMFNSLASHGIKMTGLTQLTMTSDQIVDQANLVPQALEAIEGPNEPNYQSNWVPRTRAFVQMLHATVKGNASLAKYPILAPAIPGEQSALGDISQYVDYGNMHDYFGGYNPETTGWGSLQANGTVYGSLAFNVAQARIESGSLPVMSTETGWGSQPDGSSFIANTLPYSSAAKYAARVYFVHFNAGVPRTFSFAMSDEASFTSGFGTYGLTDANGKPKPSLNAIQSIISTLGDGGTSFSAQPLTYNISGNVANVQHTLLEKHDGSYYLAIWLGTPIWNPNTHQAQSVTPQNVTVTLQRGISSSSITTLDVNGTSSTSTLSPKAGSVSFPVTDTVSIVKLSS